MEREELLGQVTAELGEYHLTLSERTINEELDDALADFGDDETANKGLVTKIANRLKRMDGNLHSDVSTQVKQWKDKQKAPKPTPKPTKKDDEENDDVPDYIKKLNARLDAMEEARKREQTERTKNALVESVKNGLTAKMKDAGLTVNTFFLGTALSKLQVPEEKADVNALVENLEKLYNADMKAAGVEAGNSSPRRNSGNGTNNTKLMDEYFAKKAKREGWSKDKK